MWCVIGDSHPSACPNMQVLSFHHLCSTPLPRLLHFNSIQALMSAPNPDDPLDEAVARHWKGNEVEAMDTARAWTAQYARS